MSELPMWLYLSYHRSEPYPRKVPLEEVYATLDLPVGDRQRPFVYLNMVQTFDGQAALDGRAFTIGTAVDHHLFRQLRVHADAVLYGAGTLRKDDVIVTTHPALQERRIRRGQSPNPLAIVVSAACEFSPEVFTKKFFSRTDFNKLVITTPRATSASVAKVKSAGVPVEMVTADPDGRVDPVALLRYLADRGITRLLAEGGPTLNVSLARLNLLDELFVTTALRLGGDLQQPRMFAQPVTDRPLVLISEFHYQTPEGPRELYFRFQYPKPYRWQA